MFEILATVVGAGGGLTTKDIIGIALVAGGGFLLWKGITKKPDKRNYNNNGNNSNNSNNYQNQGQGQVPNQNQNPNQGNGQR